GGKVKGRTLEVDGQRIALARRHRLQLTTDGRRPKRDPGPLEHSARCRLVHQGPPGRSRLSAGLTASELRVERSWPWYASRRSAKASAPLVISLRGLVMLRI